MLNKLGTQYTTDSLEELQLLLLKLQGNGSSIIFKDILFGKIAGTQRWRVFKWSGKEYHLFEAIDVNVLIRGCRLKDIVCRMERATYEQCLSLCY